jgi:uncharacterized protein YdaL
MAVTISVRALLFSGTLAAATAPAPSAATQAATIILLSIFDSPPAARLQMMARKSHSAVNF